MKKNCFVVILMTLVLLLSPTLLLAEGYEIYPIPHSVTMGSGRLVLYDTFVLEAEDGIDAATRQRALDIISEHGGQVADVPPTEGNYTTLRLGIVESGQAVDAFAFTDLALSKAAIMAEGKFDRHALSVSQHGITIVGEHTTAVFHALASLEQMLEQTTEDALEMVVIYDCADQQNRGLVEGYYGYPYSIEVKKDLMRHMMRYKMNTYMYGAKSDPYHSQMWKEAYPVSITEQQEKNGWLTQDMIREISAVSEATKVNFIWAIHPGNEFLGSSTVIDDIMSKFEKMYDLGVRHFGVFVDDVGIPSSDADMQKNAERLTGLQQAIEQKWNDAPASPEDTVRPLHFVPQIYCSSFASSADQRQRFMRALSAVPQYITVYTTGQGVWSVPNNNHTANVVSEFGRPMAWWWNYPCNDNADGQIYPMDMYSNFVDMPSIDGSSRLPSSLSSCRGLVANPMQQGEVAKTSLFSVADYAWNNAGFNNSASWEASFKPLVSDPTVRQAYHDITYYLRWNDPESLSAMITAYKASVQTGTPSSASLLQLMGKVRQDCELVMTLQQSETQSDRLLYSDIAPWLQTLHTYAIITEKMLAIMDRGADAREDNWVDVKEVCDSLESLERSVLYTAFALEGMGNDISVSQRQALVSRKYLYPFITWLRSQCIDSFLEDRGALAEPIVVTNSKLIHATLRQEGLLLSLSLASSNLDVDKYVGISLPKPTLIDRITLADNLRPLLRYSDNGKDWHSLEDGELVPQGYVSHILLHNRSEQGIRDLALSQENFAILLGGQVQPVSATLPSGSIYQNHNASLLIDGDYSTWTCLNRNQQAGDAYVLDLGSSVVLHDVRLCMGTVNGDCPTGALVQYSTNGSRWTSLKVKGTNTSTWSLSLEQNVQYSGEMVYCDFDGAGNDARYVRLYVSNPNTAKWLRLYEMQVNRVYAETCTLAPCTDAAGVSLPELSDAKGTTGVPHSALSPLTYSFNNTHEVSSVAFYAKSSTVQPTISVTTDGEQWTQLVTLLQPYTLLDLQDYPNAKAVRVEWEGSEVPALYEIIANYNASSSSLPTEGSALLEAYAELKQMSINALDSCGEGAKLITSNRQFSSPYTETAEGSINNLLDGRLNTFWHSAWNSGEVQDGVHYLEIALPENTQGDVSMHFGRRNETTGHHLLKATILGVTSGSGASAATEVVTSLDMPYGAPGETVISRFSLPKAYGSIRLREERTSGAYNAGSSGFFHVAELQLYPIVRYWELRGCSAEADDLRAAMEPMPSEATEADYANLKTAYDMFMYKVFGIIGDGIQDIPSAMPSATPAFYDLSGRRIAAPRTAGIYLSQGKKVLVK